jgi:hypothetical protein
MKFVAQVENWGGVSCEFNQNGYKRQSGSLSNTSVKAFTS